MRLEVCWGEFMYCHKCGKELGSDMQFALHAHRHEGQTEDRILHGTGPERGQ